MAEYRIEYTIQRTTGDPDDCEFEDIGFGSSGSSSDVEAALYAIQSDIQNGLWETEGDMPDPDEVLADIERAREEARA